MNEIIICEECGKKLEYRVDKTIQGLFCPECGWKVITTYIPDIYKDNKIYNVYLSTPINKPNKKMIKAVSSVCNINFLQAKLKLNENHSLLFSGRAADVVKILKVLENAEIQYYVDPLFSWPLNDNLSTFDGV